MAVCIKHLPKTGTHFVPNEFEGIEQTFFSISLSYTLNLHLINNNVL